MTIIAIIGMKHAAKPKPPPIPVPANYPKAMPVAHMPKKPCQNSMRDRVPVKLKYFFI